MKLTDFDYHLPTDRIAQQPIEPRDSSTLMIIDRQQQTISHAQFSDLADFLQAGNLIVRNNSKVIPARILARKSTGGKVEILLDQKLANDDNSTTYLALTKPGLKVGQEIICATEDGKIQITGRCESVGDDPYTRVIKFSVPHPVFIEQLAEIGETPLPKYIHTDNPDQWQARYQTIYAKNPGSSASPTAGLHFTKAVEEKLQKKEIETAELTLHVGLGTFLSVRTEDIEQHQMHYENFELSSQTVDQINLAKAAGRRIVSIGTTTTRVLESCANENGTLQAKTGQTNIFIYPPYQFKCVDALITNFHLPKTTLLMMVSAFVSQPNGPENFKSFSKSLLGKAYQQAIENDYRFYSFGDSMLII